VTQIDPFSADESARTFVLPDDITQTGTATAAVSAHPLSGLGAGPRQLALDLPEIRSGSNELVAAANHLLNLIPQIRTTPQNANPAALRDYLVQEVRRFELQARSSGATPETVVGARYCLCTALDETAGQTPWGGSGVWGRHSLLVTFHNETWGGEKFFQLLAKLAQNPQQHRDLLELMYYCIALGFEGRYRIIDNGRTQLEVLKQRLFDILKTSRGEHPRALSPNWRGLEAEYQGGWGLVPLWVIATATALVGLMIFLTFLFRLEGFSDGLYTTIANLRMPRVTIVAKQAPPRLAKFLEPEIKEGLVAVRDEADRSVVTLRGDGLFESGSAAVRDQYLRVIDRIAQAMLEVDGKIVVSGFTDNVPIRTARFPSNYQLSEVRANSVKDLLASKVPAARVRAEGRGEADPVAANDSSENRARNRRVEITLLLSAEEISRQLGAKK
jgi:type VI secretion system protein ImpK